MQKHLLFIVAALVLSLSSFKGLDDVISALNRGNASELAKYVDDNIEIVLPSKRDRYSKAQALMVFRDFFANSNVYSFELKHKGDNSEKQFCVGSLHTRAGTYRTTVFMDVKNGRQLVKEIRFQVV